MYTSDGRMHESGDPFVLLGVRGMLYVELLAKGADWDNHSGNKEKILIEGFYDDLHRLCKDAV